MSKFENMKKLRGLAESPPSETLAITDERMRDLVREQAETIKQQRKAIENLTEALAEDEGES